MSWNTEQPMEDRLWEYIDGLCSPTERSAIETLLATNREWQQKHQELLHFQQLLNESELEAPSMRFTKNVMEEITRHHVAPATKSYINKNIIRSIGAFYLTMIVGVLAYLFSQFKWTSGSGSGGDNTFNLPVDKLARLGNMGANKTFYSTWFSLSLLIVVVLGFMLLDMYLQQKKQSRSI
ncbi:anti-sigma factor family protein [Puia dinghuensis]|uniref:Zinc-finger domain-containing protein n=1 Tax=Puia dinghuensis TaxID=1792502 RepID=A0A8J2XS28_9BACT|nr:hypothetical protein [Puia dinghuensis]GGA91590.1 hypothetical protein GCM10011511_13680 [Puia dinghuensis]